MTEEVPDRFSQAYGTGIVDDLSPPLTAAGRGLRPGREGPPDGLAVGGCILTPDGPLEGGWVVIGPDGSIADIARRRPDSVPAVDTGGVVLPGLIDLHGHPEFNIFAAWEPPTLFPNRYEWRSSDTYRQVVREPQNRLLDALPAGTQARYAEVRALVGGVTAIQGATARYPAAGEALVRNVDLHIFGHHRARAMIDLPSEERPDNLPRLNQILGDIGAEKVAAFYLHLAEGRQGDARSVREFDRAIELGALTRATVVIHGTALSREHFGVMRDLGAKLVWSPQSQLRLYGEATLASDVVAAGVPLGLGADWLPSGSPSLLAELKVARRVLARQGCPATARELVAMVTSEAAAIAGLADHLGVLAPGRPADVVVLERHHDDAWENVVEAEPAWVELVTIGGGAAYGRDDWVGQLFGADGAAGREPVVAWGKPMLLDLRPGSTPGDEPPPTLSQLRAQLIAQYPQVGPIFA